MFRLDNIILKKLTRDHLEALLDLKSETWLTTHQITIANMDDQIRWFESLDTDVHTPKNLVLIASAKNENDYWPHVGIYKIANIDWANRTADVAWDIFFNHRGKKLGKALVLAGTTFCFRVFNLHRLNCEILESNIPSQKCAEWAGFKKEGVKRESAFKNGFFIDSGVYGVLEQDFALQLTKNGLE